jgi:putative transposase
VTDVYEFIDAEYASCHNAPAVTQMCAWLEVSKSGFYGWKSRPESATAKRQERLRLLIAKIFDDSDGTYGYRRIAGELARQGIAAGAELVRRLMRQLGLVACQPRPWRPATTRQGQAGPIPDLVNRDFSAEVPGQKMVGDITYIPTWQGWAFLATVIDCATRKCVGWAVDDHYRTPLITAAITMAARNIDLPDGAVFHSDRGSNGGFNWSSQHPDHGGVRWDWESRCRWRLRVLGGSGRRIGRCGRRCGHRAGLSRLVRCSGSSGG